MPDNNTQVGVTFLDGLMAALLAMVITVAVLYPETFVSDFPFFGSERTQPLSIMLPVIVLACIVYAVSRWSDLHIDVVDVSVLAFAAYFMARNVVTDKEIIAIKYALMGVGLFFLTTLLAERLRLARIIMWIFVGLAFVTCAYALLEVALQKNIIYEPYISQFVPDPPEGMHRAGSSLAHPVVFGAYIIQILPFCILAYAVGRNRLQKTLGLVSSVVVVLALFFTFTKGSWIIALLAAGGISTYLLIKRGKKGMYIALLLLALGTLIIGIFWQQVQTEMRYRADISIDLRLITWEATLKSICEAPLFGVGLKQGGEEIYMKIDEKDRARILEASSNNPPTDNHYLGILLEEGIIGLALWLIALILIIREGVIMVWRDATCRPFAIAALVGIVGITLNAITFDLLMIWSNYVIFWITAGLLHGLWKAKCRTDPSVELKTKAA